MISLRHPLLWMLLGWALLLLVATGSVIPGVVVSEYDAADKVVHMLSYFVLMVWFSGMYARRRQAAIALTLILFGIVLGFIQAELPYRQFDPLDLVANATGILLGLCLSLLVLAGWCQRVERVLGS